MRQLAGRRLWLGHAGDLRNPVAIMDLEIGAVVELADSELPAVLPRELVRLRFPLSDGGENPAWLFRLASQSVAALLRAGVPTLVCCSAGMSRSVCIAAGGIAIAEGVCFADAIAIVTRDGPADISPALFDQMQRALTDSSDPAPD